LTVVDDHGDFKMSDATMEKALEKVLSDVPALKGSTQQNNGFVQIGGSGGSNDHTACTDLWKGFQICECD